MAITGRRKTSINFAQIVIALVTLQQTFHNVAGSDSASFDDRPPPCFR